MKLKVKGITKDIIEQPIVGKVTFENGNKTTKNEILIIDREKNIDYSGFKSIIIKSMNKNSSINNNIPKVFVPYIDHLENDDIISIAPSGLINTLYKNNHTHNSMFVTDRCNSNCLMCSQPPKDKDDIDYLYNINMQLIPLLPKTVDQLGVTGGEPTLLGNKLLNIIDSFHSHLPDSHMHILSNGRVFAWKDYTKNLSTVNHSKLVFGIPLYSDYPLQHDYIVQAKDAFSQTVLGLHNLEKYGIKVEIRIVVHKQSIGRLYDLAKFIYKNLPFVSHIAIMGLEYVGYTPHNDKLLWIEPDEYIDVLSNTLFYLDHNNLHVSLYNTPLCLVPKYLWKFCRRSISDWKQIYLDECKLCTKNSECSGVFETSKRYSENIKAIT